MSRTTRQHRIAAVAATRRWRQRQAKGIRLVTVEVSEARLARIVADRLIPDTSPCDFSATVTISVEAAGAVRAMAL